MINNTTLVGRLTKNPELKYTGSGIAVTNFTLAVERNYTNAQGERETDFINCVAWRQAGEAVIKFSVKGSLVAVTGSIQTRTYENNSGNTVYVTEINVDKFQTLESKAQTDERRKVAGMPVQNTNTGGYKSGATAPRKAEPKKDDNPFANANFSNDDPFASNDDVSDINDDDLPF